MEDGLPHYYEYQVMPYGYINTSAVFFSQAFEAFSMDDSLIFSQSLLDHALTMAGEELVVWEKAEVQQAD